VAVFWLDAVTIALPISPIPSIEIFIASASCVADINVERQPKSWLANNMPRSFAIAPVLARDALISMNTSYAFGGNEA
jgi:hypothetical protein